MMDDELGIRDWQYDIIRISIIVFFLGFFTFALFPIFLDAHNTMRDLDLELTEIRNNVEKTIDCDELKTIALNLLDDGWSCQV